MVFVFLKAKWMKMRNQTRKGFQKPSRINETPNAAAKSEEHSEAPSNDMSNSQEENQNKNLTSESGQDHVTML